MDDHNKNKNFQFKNNFLFWFSFLFIIFLCIILLYFFGLFKTGEEQYQVNNEGIKKEQAKKNVSLEEYANEYYQFMFSYPEYLNIQGDYQMHEPENINLSFESHGYISSMVIIKSFSDIEKFKVGLCVDAVNAQLSCSVSLPQEKIKNGISYNECIVKRGNQTILARYIERKNKIIAFMGEDAPLKNNLEILDSMFESLSYSGEWDNLMIAKIRTVNSEGELLTNFPMKIIQPIGFPDLRGERGANYHIFTSDEDGIINVEVYPQDDVFVLSAHPDYKIDDDFCEYNDSLDCRYSLKNFNTLSLRSPSKASETQGHRIVFETEDETKELVLKVLRMNDSVYFNINRYSPNRRCEDFSFYQNANTLMDKEVLENLDFKEYFDSGYYLEDLCRYGDKNLLLLNYGIKFEEGLSDSDIYDLSERSIIGVADKNYKHIDFYNLNIEDYGQGEAVSASCNFEKIKEGNILFICKSGHDSGSRKTWYAYDMKNKDNIKVKDYYHYVDGTIKGKEYRDDLLQLFSIQNAGGLNFK